MNPNLSTYLDLVRFFAALMVFLGHASGQNWTGGFLWQTGEYAQTAVVIFFVLSGFVIRHVERSKENSWQEFTASRASRLWSVVIPALLVTFVIDSIGVRVAPDLYIDKPWYAGDHLWLRYLTSFFLLHQVWWADLYPGINTPFWSLGFELIYYALFAVLVFVPGKKRWAAFAAVALLGGPLIFAMFPIWWLGVIAYDMGDKPIRSQLLAWLMVLAGAVLLVAARWILVTEPFNMKILGRPGFLGDYVSAFAFFAHLIGVRSLFGPQMMVSSRIRRVIFLVASTTFPLYLIHRPVMQFFSYVGPEDAASWQRRVLVIAGTLVVVAALTPMTEALRRSLMVWASRWTKRVTGG